MGTSFTSFNGYGFWARDGCVAVWMANLVHEIDKLQELTEEQQVFRDALILQASLQTPGAVSDCLTYITDSENLRLWALCIGRNALRKYVGKGDWFDGNWLDGLMTAAGAVNTRSPFGNVLIRSDSHVSYAKKWLSLLEGDFDCLPLSPIGKYHATGEIEVDLSFHQVD